MNYTNNNIDIVINNALYINDIYNPCPYCFGTGMLKAMQGMCLYDGKSVRGNDTLVKCKHCKGTGVKYERN